MKTKMKTTLLLLLFLVAHADASGETDLKCSKKTIAEHGKDVTLDCYCEPRCHVTGEELKWKFNQKTFVLAYIGTSDAKNQDAQFKGRTKVSSTERLSDGNFPVTISKVIKSDEGTYTCHVGSKTCSVELKAKEFKLKCTEETIKALVGENVTLNCTSEPQLDLTGEKITWKYNSTVLFDFKDRKMFLNKDEHTKGRVHRVSDLDVSEGKLSVKISSVKESDTGNYTCSVVNGPNCTVTLTVTKEDKQTGARDDDTPPPPPSDGPNPGTISGIVVGVLVLVVGAALAAGLIYRKRRTQRGREQDGEELKRVKYQRGRAESPTGE